MRFSDHCFKTYFFGQSNIKEVEAGILKTYPKLLAEDTGFNSESEIKNLMGTPMAPES